MGKIQQEWEAFEEMCGLTDAHPKQRSEMRRAFFSGAFAVLARLGSSGQQIDMNTWAELYQEAHRFGVDQMRRDRERN